MTISGYTKDLMNWVIYMFSPIEAQAVYSDISERRLNESLEFIHPLY